MRTLLCILCLILAIFVTGQPASAKARKAFWVSGYYPGWVQEGFPPTKIRMDGLTHLFHFAATIHPDGTFTLEDFMLSEPHIAATVSAAHAAGKKVLIVLGGANSGAGFHGAAAPKNRDKFIAAIIDFVAKHQYDGVDIDWEPLPQADNDEFKAFVRALRAALKAQDPAALLTAAAALDPHGNPEVGKVYADLQNDFDQINLMTYVLAGPWEGWITWHGSPLYSADGTLPGGMPLPSIESNMENFVAAGVAPAKLGIGIAFHGDVWSGGTGTPTGGVTAPRQFWQTPPTVKEDSSYADIVERYYTPERAHFDKVAGAPYLSIDEPGSENDFFISYTDAPAIRARLKFMQKHGFGGCILWHLGQDALPDGTQPLADAVAQFLSGH